MKMLSKVLQTATAERRVPKSTLQEYLLAYRATPHSTTGKPPAEVLFNRKFRTMIPRFIGRTNDPDIRAKDAEAKAASKARHDKPARIFERKLQVGDTVLLENTKKQKASTEPAYEPRPYTVTNVKHSRVTVKNGMDTVLRDTSRLKRLPVRPPALVPRREKYPQTKSRIYTENKHNHVMVITGQPDWTDYAPMNQRPMMQNIRPQPAAIEVLEQNVRPQTPPIEVQEHERVGRPQEPPLEVQELPEVVIPQGEAPIPGPSRENRHPEGATLAYEPPRRSIEYMSPNGTVMHESGYGTGAYHTSPPAHLKQCGKCGWSYPDSGGQWNRCMCTEETNARNRTNSTDRNMEGIMALAADTPLPPITEQEGSPQTTHANTSSSDSPTAEADWEGGIRARDRVPPADRRIAIQKTLSKRRLARSRKVGLDGMKWKLEHLARKPPAARGRDDPYPEQRSSTSEEEEFEGLEDARGWKKTGRENPALPARRRKQKQSEERSARAKLQGQRASGEGNSRGGFASKNK